jgi:hypothetical protein
LALGAGEPDRAAEAGAAAGARFAALNMAFHCRTADALVPLTASR